MSDSRNGNNENCWFNECDRVAEGLVYDITGAVHSCKLHGQIAVKNGGWEEFRSYMEIKDAE